MKLKTELRKQEIFLCFAFAALAALPAAVFGQQAADEEEDLEEVIVVGSQIEGARINQALAVSVLSAEEILQSGIESGDELLQLLPEHGQNFFSEAENISGGINSARGDVGAFNLRNLGTGNTLVLLNGRRVVNASTFQTEEIGGSFVPVVTANSNSVPVTGVKRVEVLRDGASAIYGADAVAGVVNTVLKDNLDGLTLRLRTTSYANIDRGGLSFGAEWGQDFNDGDTNLGVFFQHYERNAVRAREDPRWANAELRDLIPAGSPWEDNVLFRNTSANSSFGQFDLVSSASDAGIAGTLTDPAGELEVFPLGHENCDYALNDLLCGAVDGAGTLRYNSNEHRDLSGKLDRNNLFVYLNHQFDNDMELFTEFSYYASTNNVTRQPSASLSAVKLEVGASNYYNPFGPTGSPNRLSDAVLGEGHNVPTEGLALIIDNYRYIEVPRRAEIEASSFRILQGFRGSVGTWEWEAAFLHSSAQRDDITADRISNTLMQQALNDPTPNAYNPFSNGVNTNVERALISVSRSTETVLTSIDARFVHDNLFELNGGPATLLAGTEYRRESFEDDRDPRLDGTIRFTDRDGDTFPFVSDVVNSSPTPDGGGARNVLAAFTELQLPILDSLSMQAALRFEDFSDVDSALVSKFAVGWQAVDQVLLRGSFSQAYRVPNLITINEELVVRANTRRDYVCQYALDNSASDDVLSCNNTIERRAQGSRNLSSEESVNTSFGLVIAPIEGMSITLDTWTIEQDGTVGLFGETNHTLVELLDLIAYGAENCANAPEYGPSGRDDLPTDAAEIAAYTDAGICPVGQLLSVSDRYANLDTRTLSGMDIGFYYRINTANAGTFNVKFNLSRLDEYDQEATGLSSRLAAAQAAGTLPASYPITGFADLIGRDGNQDRRWSLRTSWKRKNFGASLSAVEIGEFYQNALTLADGRRYIIPSMRTYDGTFDYTLTRGDISTRFRIGIKNLTNERAPLADRFFGYFADAHSDFGRYTYLDVNVKF